MRSDVVGRRAGWLALLVAGCVRSTLPDDCASPLCGADTAVDTDATLDSEPADTDTDVVPVDTEPVDTDTGAPGLPCLDGGPVLRVGTGVIAFQPITPGQDLILVFGPQGGWHVNVSFEAEHVPREVLLEWRLVVVSTGRVITAEDPFRRRVSLDPSTGSGWACSGSWAGERAIVDFATLDTDTDLATTPTWQALCGVDVRLEAAVRGLGAGSTPGPVWATSDVTFRIQPDPYVGAACP